MSNKHLKPIFWGIFSGGGTAAALALAPMIVVICILLPFGVLGSPDSFYENAHYWINHWFFLVAFSVLVFLFMWHGAHRLYYILHDMHYHVGNGVRYGLYTLAVVAFLVTLFIGLS
ncbi:fumarate reductase subunit FrdD [Psychrobacter lutiphocae]|uniref:fumarate reductase subunit FrdD n=1 Tax=Psychrobacter lutiphocae TaxID=540500 RepID=UPI000368920D|nr:fumarate reductase subunit FrdD [Psychrobacter lutiphocae]